MKTTNYLKEANESDKIIREALFIFVATPIILSFFILGYVYGWFAPIDNFMDWLMFHHPLMMGSVMIASSILGGIWMACRIYDFKVKVYFRKLKQLFK